MQNLIRYLWVRYLLDRRGIETLEWILIGGLITGVAIVLYPGVLQNGLSTALQSIVNAIASRTPPAAS